MKTLNGHSNVVRSVAISKNEKTIVSAGYDSVVKVWNVELGVEIKSMS